MKVFNNTTLFIGFFCLALPTLLSANDKKEFVRTVKKEFLGMSNRTTMQLYNQYGKIDIHPATNLNAEVSVRMSVFATDEAEAEKAFKRIKINFDNTNTWAKAETSIESSSWGWGSSCGEFKIDYDVTLPSVANLDLRNQYGASTIPDMEGNVKANVEYGNLNIGKMNGSLDINIQYGNVEIAGSRDATIQSEYSNIDYTGNAANLRLNAQYGEVHMADANDVNITAEYTNFKIGNIKSLQGNMQYGDVRITSATNLSIKSEYTNYRIGSLTGAFSYEGNYGDIDIEGVGRNFTVLDFEGDYTNIQIEMPEGVSFSYDIRGEYADFKLPAGAKPANSDKSDYNKHWWGSTGTGSGKITSRTNYGHIIIR